MNNHFTSADRSATSNISTRLQDTRPRLSTVQGPLRRAETCGVNTLRKSLLLVGDKFMSLTGIGYIERLLTISKPDIINNVYEIERKKDRKTARLILGINNSNLKRLLDRDPCTKVTFCVFLA